jgi:hypothetical protein
LESCEEEPGVVLIDHNRPKLSYFP